MRRPFISAAALLAGFMLLPARASAQLLPDPWADSEDRPPRVDLSASFGVLVPTNWSTLVLLGSVSSGSGVVEQILARELRVEADQSYGGALTYWEGRYGLRFQGGYSKSALKISGAAPIGIKTWLYDVRGVIGALEYKPSRVVLPYGFVGVGGVTYDLAQTVTPPLTFITQAPALPSAPNTIIVGDRGRQFILSEEELGVKTVFALTFGAGTDIRVPIGPGGIGLRLEVSDHWTASPLDLRVTELTSGVTSYDSRVQFGAVHHLSATVGFILQIGR